MIAGELLDGSHIYGEVTWKKERVGFPVLNELISRAKASGYGGANGQHFILFSKSGFTDCFREQTAIDSSVILVEIEDVAFVPHDKLDDDRESTKPCERRIINKR